VPRFVQDGQQVRGEVLRELHHEGLEAVHRHGVRAQGTVPTRSTRRTTGASLGNTKNHFSPGGGFRFRFRFLFFSSARDPVRRARASRLRPLLFSKRRRPPAHRTTLFRARDSLFTLATCVFLRYLSSPRHDLSRRCTITNRAPCTI
jgi:hypothetical protein